MSQVISYFNTKGGVGKTMSAVCSAYALSELGYSVLVIDMCANGDISHDFGFDRFSFAGNTSYEWLIGEKKISEVAVEVPGTNIHFIPSDDKIGRAEDWIKDNVIRGKDEILARKLEQLKGHFSHILLDCHPDQNDLQSVMSLIASDKIYIPVTTDGNTVGGALRSARIGKQLQKEGLECEYLLVPTMIKTNDFGKDKRVIEKLMKAYEKEGIHNFSDISVPYNGSIGDFTRQEKTFTEMRKHKGTEEMFQSYKEIAEKYLVTSDEGSLV
ncbi:ParA family protein [Bacillus sp. BML-BC060]|uniref:ParA family protein n=1 Tax=Bacillus sp. BML-BC060 TaxID=2842487 RepID=UPI001C7EC287|nr:ParA family protein [Bacillus sp. BML-BC060]